MVVVGCNSDTGVIMNAKEFVSLWKSEKEDMLISYTKGDGKTLVENIIQSMDLSEFQLEKLKKMMDVVLTDTFYGLLLGLVGESQIGGVQESYTILDSSGSSISDNGDIEAEAWHQFHGE